MRERFEVEVRRQASSGRAVFWAVVIALILLAIALVIGLQRGIGVGGVLRDPYSLTHERWTSVVSNGGVMLWVVVVSVCGFCAAMVDRTRPPGDRWRSFFRGGAIVTGILLIDDALSFHESGDDLWTTLMGNTPPGWIEITEILFWAVVAAAFALYFWRTRDVVARTEYLLLVLTAVLLGASIVVDVVGSSIVSIIGGGDSAFEVLEEGLKLVGIVVYVSYFLRAAAHGLRESRIRGSTATATDA